VVAPGRAFSPDLRRRFWGTSGARGCGASGPGSQVASAQSSRAPFKASRQTTQLGAESSLNRSHANFISACTPARFVLRTKNRCILSNSLCPACPPLPGALRPDDRFIRHRPMLPHRKARGKMVAVQSEPIPQHPRLPRPDCPGAWRRRLTRSTQGHKVLFLRYIDLNGLCSAPATQEPPGRREATRSWRSCRESAKQARVVATWSVIVPTRSLVLGCAGGGAATGASDWAGAARNPKQ
jgi:hypothetical protein